MSSTHGLPWFIGDAGAGSHGLTSEAISDNPELELGKTEAETGTVGRTVRSVRIRAKTRQRRLPAGLRPSRRRPANAPASPPRRRLSWPNDIAVGLGLR